MSRRCGLGVGLSFCRHIEGKLARILDRDRPPGGFTPIANGLQNELRAILQRSAPRPGPAVRSCCPSLRNRYLELIQLFDNLREVILRTPSLTISADQAQHLLMILKIGLGAVPS